MGRRRFTAVSSSGDHGLLLGLGDDDHLQYLRTDGARAFTGDLLPSAADARSIGSAARELLNLYMGDAGRIYLGLGQGHHIRVYPTVDDLEIRATTRFLICEGQARFLAMSNCYYDNANFQRINVANRAWFLELDSSDDTFNIFRVAAGANPIAWTTLLMLFDAGMLWLPITGAGAGLFLGDDTQIYEGAASRLDLASGDSLNLVLGDISLAATRTVDGVDLSMYSKFALEWQGHAGAVNTGSTAYVGLDGVDATENHTQIPVPEAAVAVSLFIQVLANTLDSASPVTLRLNGAGTAITISIPAGGTGVYSDVAHNVAFAAGALASIQVVAGGSGAQTITIGGASVKFAQSAA